MTIAHGYYTLYNPHRGKLVLHVWVLAQYILPIY